MRVFSGPSAPPPNRLLAHTYGVKNVYTGVIRLYAAYNLHDRHLYDLAILTFVGVLVLYLEEFFVRRTVGVREFAIPFVTSVGGLVWMGLQRGAYLA